MSTHLSKYFGEFELADPEEWYETEIEFNERTLEVLMTCSSEAKNIDQTFLQTIDDFIDNFSDNEKLVRLSFIDDFKNGGETKTYIDSQIENQESEEIENLIDRADEKLNNAEKLLSVINLLRVVFYPEKEDRMFAIFDYTISEDLTDELLVFKLYKDKKNRICIES